MSPMLLFRRFLLAIVMWPQKDDVGLTERASYRQLTFN